MFTRIASRALQALDKALVFMLPKGGGVHERGYKDPWEGYFDKARPFRGYALTASDSTLSTFPILA